MANDNENNIPDAGIGQPGFSLQTAGGSLDNSWDKRGDPYAAATRAPAAASGSAASGAPGALPAPGPGDISLDSLTLGSDGHLYGERRIISGDPNNPGQSRYDFESVDLGNATDTDTTTRPNLTALAQRWGFGNGAITTKLQELQVQNAQTKANGYGKLLSVNPDGSYSYQDATGTRQTTSDPAALEAVGITKGDIAQQKAQAGESQRTLTQMGQFSVAGMNPDGSMQVRDYNGTLSTVTAQQAAAGQIPGVSYADFQKAQSDFVNNQKTLNAAGQYEATTANPDGSIQVRDGEGRVFNVSAQQAQGLPGIASGQIQYLQQQGSDRNFLSGKVQAGGVYTPPTPANTPWVNLPGSGIAPTGGPPTPVGPPVPGSPQGGQMANTPVNFNSGPTGVATQQGGGLPGSQPPQQQGSQNFLGPPSAQTSGTGVRPQGGPLGTPTGQSAPNYLGPPTGQQGGTGVRPQGGPLGAPTASQQAAYSTYTAGSGGPTRMPPTQQGAGGTPGFLGPPTAQPPPGGTGNTFNYGNPYGYGYSANGFNGTQQDLQQANQGMANYYQYGQNQFNNVHQAQDQQNTAYRYNQLQTQNQNAGMSRNMGGMGWAGLGHPTVAGAS